MPTYRKRREYCDATKTRGERNFATLQTVGSANTIREPHLSPLPSSSSFSPPPLRRRRRRRRRDKRQQQHRENYFLPLLRALPPLDLFPLPASPPPPPFNSRPSFSVRRRRRTQPWMERKVHPKIRAGSHFSCAKKNAPKEVFSPSGSLTFGGYAIRFVHRYLVCLV